MLEGHRFSFTERTDSFGEVSTMPYLRLTLSNGNKSLEVMALLDTGASVNVLPYEIGLQLGAVWEEQTVQVALSGNLANNEARGVVLSGKVALRYTDIAGICLDSIKRCTCNPWTHELFCRIQCVFLSA